MQTRPGNSQRLSLKSTAAQKLSPTHVHISKLTEVAWIQDTRTAADRRQQTRQLFQEYQQAVNAIVMLCAFRDAQRCPQRYQLLEIPSALFPSVQTAALNTFRSDAPLIDCQVEGRTVARVALDRSDAKITVRSIQLTACTVHAKWTRA